MITRPGDVKIANLKMAIEIVDLPINSMVIFHSYVSLPEGMEYHEYPILSIYVRWLGRYPTIFLEYVMVEVLHQK